jgi:hypothetical protein
VLSLDTGSYQGKIVKRIPFMVDNPLYGMPVAELPVTAELRAQHPKATVVELYQDASLPQFGIPSYDGVRDVYFGDDRQETTRGGSCTSRGNDLSYGTDLRFQLQLGGEARRTLIGYDLGMLPKGARVAKALLMLHVEELEKKADLAYRVFALKKRWSESVVGIMGGLNVTNVADPQSRGPLYPVGKTESWEKPGCQGEGDRYPEPVASVTFQSAGWVPVDITPAAAKWASGEWANHGLAIEMAKETYVMGTRDILITASDCPVDPRLRPRLILVLEGNLKPVPCQIREQNADLKAAFARAKAEGTLVLVNVLSTGSLTSRRFESQVLVMPEVRTFISRNFLEVRLDADKPEHKEFLKAHGVRRTPSSLILTSDGEPLGLIEPFDWDAPLGLMRSGFEFEQLYTRSLSHALRDAAPPGAAAK